MFVLSSANGLKFPYAIIKAWEIEHAYDFHNFLNKLKSVNQTQFNLSVPRHWKYNSCWNSKFQERLHTNEHHPKRTNNQANYIDSVHSFTQAIKLILLSCIHLYSHNISVVESAQLVGSKLKTISKVKRSAKELDYGFVIIYAFRMT